METIFPSVLTVILVAAVATYLLVPPLVILQVFRQDAHPTIEVVEPDVNPLPEEVALQLDSVNLTLQQQGFESQGIFFLPRQVPNVRAILELFANRSMVDSAMAVTMYAEVNNQWSITHYVEFESHFRNGPEVNTNNSTVVGATATSGYKVTTYVPWITDPLKLYAIHRAIAAAKGAGARKELWLDTKFHGDAQAYLAGVIRIELEAAANDGYLRLDSASGHYRATIKGAYLMTWKLLPPFKYFVARARDRRARHLLADLGIA